MGAVEGAVRNCFLTYFQPKKPKSTEEMIRRAKKVKQPCRHPFILSY